MGSRLAATVCIGCRRLDAPQLCAQGCNEQTVELVFAEAMAAALRELEEELRDVEALRAVLLRSVGGGPAPDRSESGDESEGDGPELRAQARSVLRQSDSDRTGEGTGAGDVVRVTAGHCSVCGWIDSPQPCLDVCVFRAVEMIPAADYDEMRARCSDATRQREHLSTVVRQLAWVTPRSGEGDRTSRALESHARQALSDAEHTT